MAKTMTTVVAGMAWGLAAMASATPASAQANCEMYAKLAAQQQRENDTKQCKLSGPDWNPDASAHMTWCSSASPQQWQAALQRRKLALDNCGK